MLLLFTLIKQRVCFRFHLLQERVLRWINPSTTSLFGRLADLTRGKSELLAENALLRQQLIILCRQVKRPSIRKTTLLRWHRELFRWFWKRKSQVRSRKPKLSPETISLIKEMAANNRRLVSRTHSG